MLSSEDIEKFKKSNQELQEIINNSWDGIGIIDKSTKLIYVNNAFMPMLGFSKEELINTTLISFMEERFQKPFLNLLNIDFKEKKYKAEIDIVCIRKDKEKVYLKITITSMLNKPLFVINTKDITDQIADDEILDDYVATMHMDLHGYITKVSSAFLKLFAYNKEEILGKSFKSLIHKDTDTIVFKNIDKTLEALQEYSSSLKSVKKGNSPFWVNFKIKPMFNKYGDVTGYTSLFFDITNEINLNDESSLLQKQIKNAKEEIQQKDNLLVDQSKISIMTETLQRLSHEWRQPLNLISLQAQKLEFDYEMDKTPTSSEAIDALKKIINEANNLSKTIEDFQHFLKKDPKEAVTSPEKIIKKAITLLDDIEDTSIKIEKIYDKDFEFCALENEIALVIFNALKNAKEHIKRKNIEEGIITIYQYNNENRIIFEIKDNGGGIDENILHKIFEPYFSTKEKRHGVGLGLYISKLIVNIQLQGVITAFNNKLGATIKISIPINKEGK